MYFAHAEHHHLEENISKAYDQHIVIGACLACIVIIVAAGLIVMSLLVKRQQKKASPNK